MYHSCYKLYKVQDTSNGDEDLEELKVTNEEKDTKKKQKSLDKAAIMEETAVQSHYDVHIMCSTKQAIPICIRM